MARHERQDRNGPVTAAVVSREWQDDGGPTVDQRTEKIHGLRRIDAAVAHHGDTAARRRQVLPGWAFLRQVGQRGAAGVAAAPAVEGDDEGRAGGRSEPEGRNGAEYLVLRRPDGYRRHLELRMGTPRTV
jgi:hypothetical protein